MKASGALTTPSHSALKQALRPYWYRVLNAWRAAKSAAAGLAFDLFKRRATIDGLVFEVPRAVTDLAFRSRFLFNSHERDERTAVCQYLPADCTVLELGAGLGVVSCVINSRLHNRARHVAVEANPHLIDTIHINRDRNGMQFGVEHCVVTASGVGTFYLAPSISNSSRVDRGRAAITVPAISLTQLESKYAMRFDALVCDIEGGEQEFFADNPEFVARCRAVLIQFHPKLIGVGACDACRAALREGGLALVGTFGTNEAWVRARFTPQRA